MFLSLLWSWKQRFRAGKLFESSSFGVFRLKISAELWRSARHRLLLSRAETIHLPCDMLSMLWPMTCRDMAWGTPRIVGCPFQLQGAQMWNWTPAWSLQSWQLAVQEQKYHHYRAFLHSFSSCTNLWYSLMLMIVWWVARPPAILIP